MRRDIAVLSVLILSAVPPVSAQQFKVGDHVHSTVSGFDGTVVQTGGIDGYLQVSRDGQPPSNASWMNPKWLKPAVLLGGQGTPAVPQKGGQPGGQGGAQLRQTPPGQPGAAGRFPSGSRVEFDRAEGSKPQFGRWDSGTVVGRDQFERVQIRGSNGILYTIQDDSRWILPAGSAVPGPRHDYNNHPPAAAATPAARASTPMGGGSQGPLTGEWAVIGVDGKSASGYGMTFNFVGSRYELIHYSGETEAGHFMVSGSTVKMVQEDGSPYGTFQYSMQGNRLILQAPGTQFVLERAHK